MKRRLLIALWWLAYPPALVVAALATAIAYGLVCVSLPLFGISYPAVWLGELKRRLDRE